MKYRYPFKSVWLPALLLALCLSMTLISAIVWLIMAAANDSVESYTATAESVIPALLMLASWIGCAILAGKLRLKVLLWFDIAFWGAELILYLLCLTPLYDTAAKVVLTVGMLPFWSYFALIELIDVQNITANAIVMAIPTLIMLGVFIWQLIKVTKAEKTAALPGKKA